jgi:hypothetical protein
VLSWYPRIALFPAFVDNTTVAQIIALATPLLQPSELGAAALTDEQKANQPVRKRSVSVGQAHGANILQQPVGVLQQGILILTLSKAAVTCVGSGLYG